MSGGASSSAFRCGRDGHDPVGNSDPTTPPTGGGHKQVEATMMRTYVVLAMIAVSVGSVSAQEPQGYAAGLWG